MYRFFISLGWQRVSFYFMNSKTNAPGPSYNRLALQTFKTLCEETVAKYMATLNIHFPHEAAPAGALYRKTAHEHLLHIDQELNQKMSEFLLMASEKTRKELKDEMVLLKWLSRESFVLRVHSKR
jgi:hypothetical protein